MKWMNEWMNEWNESALILKMRSKTDQESAQSNTPCKQIKQGPI